MLWIVIHIAMTVKTGDQPSLPSMDAQIFATQLSNAQRRGVTHSHAHLSIRAVLPCIEIGSMNDKILSRTRTG